MSNSLKKSKKGYTISQMLPLAMSIIVLAIGLGLGSQVLQTIQAGQGATAINASFAYNATTFGLQGLDTFTSYIPTIALVIVAAVVIGILVTYLARRMQ